MSDTGAPTADRAGETSALGDSAVETAGAENVVAADADHQAAVENKPVAAVAAFAGGEKIIFHFSGHIDLRF